MSRRFTSRPTPGGSVIGAIAGIIMLIFGLAFFSQAKSPPPIFGLFLFVWFAAVIGAIIYHVVNATRPGGVPTQIIETDDDVSQPPAPKAKSSSERLQELQDLHNRKLISDEEFETKRQEILREV